MVEVRKARYIILTLFASSLILLLTQTASGCSSNNTPSLNQGDATKLETGNYSIDTGQFLREAT